MNPNRDAYTARLMRVVEYIDTHLTEPLSLETLAGIAHFSPFHFHRLFAAMTGETLADCIRRRRLEAAATRLVNHPRKTVLAIALEIGFEGPEVFARAFQRHFGCTASEWRRGAWREKSTQHMRQLREIGPRLRKKDQAGGQRLAEDPAMNPVVIEKLPAHRVAYLRFVGPYGAGIAETWQRLRKWSEACRIKPRNGLEIGIVLDNPHVTEPSRCRYDACIAVDETVRAQGEIGVQVTSSGRFACRDFAGTAEHITVAWNSLYGEWLPDSGHELGHGALMEIFDGSDPSSSQPGFFHCRLCLPLADERRRQS